jgi:hypothetical protein
MDKWESCCGAGLPLVSPPDIQTISRESHVHRSFLAIARRDRGFSCPNTLTGPHRPHLKRERVGVLFSLMPKATPSLVPSASGGVCFPSPLGFSCPHRPSCPSTPALALTPLPLPPSTPCSSTFDILPLHPHPRPLRQHRRACPFRLRPWLLRGVSAPPDPASAPSPLPGASVPPPH